jgi:drug/metabolite transporter (DMT)-like permease
MSQRPALAATMMIAGSLLGVCSDALTKLLTGYFTVADVALGQSLVIIATLLLATPVLGVRRVLQCSQWRSQGLRALLHVATSLLFITGLSSLALSTAVTIWFANPIYTAALAPLFLGESSSARRWLLIGAGFAGVALIANPSYSDASYLVLYPMGAALSGAFRDLLTRKMTKGVTTESMLFYSTAAMAIVAASATKSHSYLPSATFAQLSILGASGLAYMAALYLITESLRFGQASSVAPFKYSTLLWVVVLDFVIWKNVPKWNVLLGSSLIVVAMLLLLALERKRHSQIVLASAEGPV